MNRLVPTTIVLAALLPAAGFALAARWVEALLCVLAGAGWLAARNRVGWPATLGFVLLTSLAGFSALTGVPPGWGLAGITATLAAWDVSSFARRLAAAGMIVDEPGLWRAHLRRLGTVTGVGLALGAAALLIRVDLGFGWALLLSLVAIIALSRAVTSLRMDR